LTDEGVVDRLVVSGDWNENHSAVAVVRSALAAGADGSIAASSPPARKDGSASDGQSPRVREPLLEARPRRRPGALSKEGGSLTLNAQHYSSEQCEYILGFAHSLEEMELDAVIVSDVGLPRGSLRTA
jgi:hypothetical protein